MFFGNIHKYGYESRKRILNFHKNNTLNDTNSKYFSSEDDGRVEYTHEYFVCSSYDRSIHYGGSTVQISFREEFV